MSVSTVLLWVVGVSSLPDHRVEAMVVVGRVVDCTSCAVGFQQAVATLDDVAISRLPLVLHVPGVRVMHGVVELVLRVRVGL